MIKKTLTCLLAFSLQLPSLAQTTVLHSSLRDFHSRSEMHAKLFGAEALETPLDWMQRAWARSSAFLLRRQVWTTTTGTAVFAGLDYAWTHTSQRWSQSGPWHLLMTQEVTGLLSGIIANILIQTSPSDAARRRFDFKFLGRHLLGTVLLFSLVEGFLWFGHIMPLIHAGIYLRSVIQVFVAYPFIFNPVNLYVVARLWYLKNHAGTLRVMHDVLPGFFAFTTIIELGVAAFAFAFPPSMTYFIISAWDIHYLLQLDKRVRRQPQQKPSFHGAAWWGLYTPLTIVVLWMGSWAVLLGHPPGLLFWGLIFPGIALASHAGSRFIHYRLEKTAQQLKQVVDEERYFKDHGESPMSLVVRLRIPLEREYRSLIFWLNRLSEEERPPTYLTLIRRILEDASERITMATLANTDFPRLVMDYLDLSKGRASERLFSLMAVGLTPWTDWPELFEDRRTGIQQPSSVWRGPGRAWSERPLRTTERRPPHQPREIALRYKNLRNADLTVEPLLDADRAELIRWTRAWPQAEVDDDFEHFLLTGLKTGEYGYKLVAHDDGSPGIEGIVLLCNLEAQLHLHIIFARPADGEAIRIPGIGRALTELAFRDAIERDVPITTFATTPEAVRLFDSLGFKRMAVRGSHMSEMRAIWPDDMRKVIARWGGKPPARLPFVGTFIEMGVRRDDQVRRITFNDVPFESMERMLISRRLYERYVSAPESLLTLVREQADAYFEHQRREPTNLFFLDAGAHHSFGTRLLDSAEYGQTLGPLHGVAPLTPFVLRPVPPPESVRYRPAVPTDLENLLKFRNEYYARRTYAGIPATSEAFLKLVVMKEWPGDVYLAETDHGIVGYTMAYVHEDQHYAEIEEGTVVPNLQSYDVGDRLIMAARDAALKRFEAGVPSEIEPIVLIQEQSELALIAKIARRVDFVPYESIPNLWVYARSNQRSQARGNGRWHLPRPGFSPGDPRHFPSALVPLLLREATQYRAVGNKEQMLRTYTYIFRYRPWDVRVWRAWILFYANVRLAALSAAAQTAPTRLRNAA